MDEDKKNVTGNEVQPENNMDYSFDFTNQVAEQPKPVESNENTVEMASTVENNENVQNVDVTNVAANENVQSVDVANVAANENVQNVDVTNVAANENVQSVTETDSTQETVTNDDNAVSDASIEKVEDTEGSAELIKDKKETKRFLFILALVILVFIIALPFIRPFIRNFLG